MKRIISICSLLILIIATSSCRRENFPCIKGKGSVQTQSRDVSDYTRIEFQTEGTVYITVDTFYSMKIEAQQNIIDDMQTVLNGNSLKIYNKHCLKNHEPIKIYITTPSLDGIDLSGSGNLIVSSKIEAADFDLSVSGSGDIELQDSLFSNSVTTTISGSGSMKLIAVCNSLTGKISGSGNFSVTGNTSLEKFTISGSGNIHAFDFFSHTSEVAISGSGNVEINVSDNLDVTVSGSGDVYYKGNPTINTHMSGSGNLIHVN